MSLQLSIDNMLPLPTGVPAVIGAIESSVLSTLLIPHVYFVTTAFYIAPGLGNSLTKCFRILHSRPAGQLTIARIHQPRPASLARSCPVKLGVKLIFSGLQRFFQYLLLRSPRCEAPTTLLSLARRDILIPQMQPGQYPLQISVGSMASNAAHVTISLCPMPVRASRSGML